MKPWPTRSGRPRCLLRNGPVLRIALGGIKVYGSIDPRSAAERVRVLAADQSIIAGTSAQDIIAIAAAEEVAATLAVENVVAVATGAIGSFEAWDCKVAAAVTRAIRVVT